MATMLVLLLGNPLNPASGPEFPGRLARFGVTMVVVLRDRSTVGAILQGWASIPPGAGAIRWPRWARTAQLGGLQPVAEISVSPEADDHGPGRA